MQLLIYVHKTEGSYSTVKVKSYKRFLVCNRSSHFTPFTYNICATSWQAKTRTSNRNG